MVGRAAGGEQADDRVDDAALIDDLRQRQMVLPEGRDPCRAVRGGSRQRIAQRRVGRDERAAGQMQAHHFHQHLVAVGRAVERAGAGGVIASGLRLEQRLAADLALGEELADRAPFPCWAYPRASGPAGTNTVGSWPKDSAPMSRPGHDLVADAEAQRGIEHAVRQGDARRHGDDVAAEERELHAGLALRHAIAHGGHAAGDLRGRAGRTRGRANEAREALVGLVRRQHVVIGGDDGEIRPAQILQCLLVGRGGGRESVRQVGAGEALARRLAAALRRHALEVRGPRAAAALADALGDLAYAGMEGGIVADMSGFIPRCPGLYSPRACSSRRRRRTSPSLPRGTCAPWARWASGGTR